MIRFRHRGSFKNSEDFLQRSKKINPKQILEKYAREGVQALRSATPKDSGETAEAWDFEIVGTTAGFKLNWLNSSMNDGIPIAILLQYGHGTRSGTFIEGRDFINPAMRPIFDKIAENIWKEVLGK